MWGAPMGGMIIGPLTTWLIYKYTWSGTVLIFIGIVLNEFIISLFIMPCPTAPRRRIRVGMI